MVSKQSPSPRRRNTTIIVGVMRSMTTSLLATRPGLKLPTNSLCMKGSMKVYTRRQLSRDKPTSSQHETTTAQLLPSTTSRQKKSGQLPLRFEAERSKSKHSSRIVLRNFHAPCNRLQISVSYFLLGLQM